MGYTVEQLKALKAHGQAMPPTPAAAAGGKPASYPIKTLSDLESAIGLARTPQQRKFCMSRAKDLGATSKIPDNWNPDGSTS